MIKSTKLYNVTCKVFFRERQITLFQHLSVLRIRRETNYSLTCTQTPWPSHGTTNMEIAYGQHQSYKLHVNKKCLRSVQLIYTHLVTLKTYYYTALYILVNMKLWYDRHFSYPNLAMSIKLVATTQFTYKDDKHVVWLRLVPFVRKLHVGASVS